jgi:hypothetical protein
VGQGTDTVTLAPDLAPLPGEARLWIFGADRDPSPAEVELLLGRIDPFLEGWRAHGRPLSAGRAWVHDRFLLVGVDESVAPPTGCSIDALVRTLRGVEEETGLRLLEKGLIWYREGGEDGAVHAVSRERFRELGRGGAIDPDTTVFDPALTRVEELRRGEWERPAGAGWHRRLLPD